MALERGDAAGRRRQSIGRPPCLLRAPSAATTAGWQAPSRASPRPPDRPPPHAIPEQPGARQYSGPLRLPRRHHRADREPAGIERTPVLEALAQERHDRHPAAEGHRPGRSADRAPPARTERLPPARASAGRSSAASSVSAAELKGASRRPRSGTHPRTPLPSAAAQVPEPAAGRGATAFPPAHQSGNAARPATPSPTDASGFQRQRNHRGSAGQPREQRHDDMTLPQERAATGKCEHQRQGSGRRPARWPRFQPRPAPHSRAAGRPEHRVVDCVERYGGRGDPAGRGDRQGDEDGAKRAVSTGGAPRQEAGADLRAGTVRRVAARPAWRQV